MEVSDIIEAVDMSEYISQFVELEEKGGELWGLSPFKDEQTPSFSVNVDKGFWYDFSAGFGGNLIDFVMRKKKVDVRGAVNELKRYAHITEQSGEVQRGLEATRVAKRYRCKVKQPPVTTAKPLPPDYMDRFEFRVDKLKPWIDEGIRVDVMRDMGVRYDAFDDRIVFPIRDYEGNIVSVCGRTCVPDFKERKMRKYTYLQQIGTVDTLYGFSDCKDEIFRSREIILFEGAKSCMKMYGWGHRNACAILTSHLSVNQFRFLIRLASFHNVRIVFALDSDVDVYKDKNILKLTSYARVEWARNRDSMLEAKESPVDRGADTWMKLYNMRERIEAKEATR